MPLLTSLSFWGAVGGIDAFRLELYLFWIYVEPFWSYVEPVLSRMQRASTWAPFSALPGPR